MTKTKLANALQAVLDRQLREDASPPSLVPTASPPASRAGKNRASAPATTRSPFYRPVREGKRFIGGHFDPKVAKQLKLLAAEEDRTLQDLMEEALDLLFVKKGKGRIVRDNT